MCRLCSTDADNVPDWTWTPQPPIDDEIIPTSDVDEIELEVILFLLPSKHLNISSTYLQIPPHILKAYNMTESNVPQPKSTQVAAALPTEYSEPQAVEAEYDSSSSIGSLVST